MEIDPIVYFNDADPLKWIIDHQTISDEQKLASFIQMFVEKVNCLSRINEFDLKNELEKIHITALKDLRLELLKNCKQILPKDFGGNPSRIYISVFKLSPIMHVLIAM